MVIFRLFTVLPVMNSDSDCDRRKVLHLSKEQESLCALRTLHALPEEFIFAVTPEQYARISKAVDEAVATQTEAAPKNARTDAWAKALAQYDFAVEGSDTQPGLRPAAANLTAPALRWDNDSALLHRMLLERRDALTPLLYPVPETALGTVNGVPVTGRLLFDPDALLPIRPVPYRPARYGLFTILACGGRAATTDCAQTARGGLLAVCRYALSLVKDTPDSVSVSLVTDGHYSLDSALFCITASADGIQVSDYRAALEDFATAVEKYLM